MRRVLLTLSYDGTRYVGWQWQNNGISIQQKVEEALHALTRENIRVMGASRTDGGVHAMGQRCHFDTNCTIPDASFALAMNTKLPLDIRVVHAQTVPSDFHARFHPCQKQYTYRIWNSPYAHTLFRHAYAHVTKPMQSAPIHTALNDLLGTHDFAAFQAAGGTANTTIRTLHECHLTVEGNLFTLIIRGNAFLYNMVRIIAGTSIAIGQGQLPESTFSEALASHDRLTLGFTAPAHGLELTRIQYDGMPN